MSSICLASSWNEGLLKKRWRSAVAINFTRDFSPYKELKTPVDTKENIFEIIFLDHQFKLHKDCLFYEYAKKKGKSTLYISKSSVQKNCQNFHTTKNILIKKNIFNFGYGLKDNVLTLIIDDKNIDLKLLNLEKGDDYRLNSNSAADYAEKGVLLSSFESTEGEELKNGDTCFNINDNCKVTYHNICNFCPRGVREVKANNCHYQYKKICSDQACGGQGQFACLKGQKLFKELKDYCFTDSPFGFCYKPYRVFCEQGVLRCR